MDSVKKKNTDVTQDLCLRSTKTSEQTVAQHSKFQKVQKVKNAPGMADSDGERWAQRQRQAHKKPEEDISAKMKELTEQMARLRAEERKKGGLPPRIFKTNGPIDIEYLQFNFAIPPEEEDLTLFLDSIDRKQLLVYHGPRQSGKTTRMNALKTYLTENGKSVGVIDLQLPNQCSLEVLMERHEKCDVLLIDEFDRLSDHPDKSAYLSSLRGCQQASPKGVVCFGSFASAKLSTDPPVSPFNIANYEVASPFTLKEVKDLFQQFMNEWKVEVADEVVSAIYKLTSGHRGLVTCAGDVIQTRAKDNKKRLEVDEWLTLAQRLEEKIIAAALFTRARATLRDGMKVEKSSIYTILATMRTKNDKLTVPDLSELDKSVGGRKMTSLAEVLTDLGLLQANKDGSEFNPGPPVFDNMWKNLYNEKQLQLPVKCHGDTKETLLFLCQSVLPHVKPLFDGGSTKTRESDQLLVPAEAAYCTIMSRLYVELFGTHTLIPQVSVGDKAIDFVVELPWGRGVTIVEVCAHCRAENEMRDGSVAEHCKRVVNQYVQRVRDLGKEVDGAWVINFAVPTSKTIKKNQSAVKRAGVHVLHVFHDMQFQLVEPTFYHSA